MSKTLFHVLALPLRPKGAYFPCIHSYKHRTVQGNHRQHYQSSSHASHSTAACVTSMKETTSSNQATGPHGNPRTKPTRPTLLGCRKAEQLDLASTPSDARYAIKLPLHKPTICPLRAPATKDDRETPLGPATSSPRSCKSFIAELPVGLHGERDETVAVGLHSCVRRPLLLVPERAPPRLWSRRVGGC
jgi:hypothetical protein